ncbi:MAG: ubiquinol-cytochrome C chaperone family protein [Pseudomonadota bacterium]|nr:ubiquinol-cytochrome C chaperone family protein [Pseudomonadota bacterium]
MIFKINKHERDLYNTLLSLSRNIFFYTKIKLKDTFDTRIFLMFIHFSIMMIVFKKKGKKFNQDSYDSLFHNIENNLREAGFGDVSVNKKMKDFNKQLYDILLKIENKNNNSFKLNKELVIKYFNELDEPNKDKFIEFDDYFKNFYNFCFELPLDNMIREAINFR